MSLTLNPPTRLTALVGALVLTGLAAVVFMLGRGVLAGEPSTPVATPSSVTKEASSPTSAPKAATPRPVTSAHAKVRVSSGFPARVEHALRYNRVVVVSVSLPGAAVDAIVRREARAAAKAGRAGFVAISAENEPAVARLVAKTGILPDPAVVVLKRPGVVTTTFSVADAATIAQAVAEARR